MAPAAALAELETLPETSLYLAVASSTELDAVLARLGEHPAHARDSAIGSSSTSPSRSPTSRRSDAPGSRSPSTPASTSRSPRSPPAPRSPSSSPRTPRGRESARPSSAPTASARAPHSTPPPASPIARRATPKGSAGSRCRRTSVAGGSSGSSSRSPIRAWRRGAPTRARAPRACRSSPRTSPPHPDRLSATGPDACLEIALRAREQSDTPRRRGISSRRTWPSPGKLIKTAGQRDFAGAVGAIRFDDDIPPVVEWSRRSRH